MNIPVIKTQAASATQQQIDKSTREKGLFAEHFNREHYLLMGIPLEYRSKVIDFEMFGLTLESEILNIAKKNNSRGKTFVVVMGCKQCKPVNNNFPICTNNSRIVVND